MDMLAPLPPSLPPSVLCSMGSGTAGAMLFLYHIIIRAPLLFLPIWALVKGGGREGAGGSYRIGGGVLLTILLVPVLV